MTDSELAWAAGLFEGEGTVHIRPFTPYNLGTLIVAVTNTDRQILDYFQSRWGGLIKRVSVSGPNRRPAFQWLLTSARASSFLALLLPFVITKKYREKFEAGISFQAGKLSPGAGRHLSAERRAEYRAEQLAGVVRMKELNVRGRGALVASR